MIHLEGHPKVNRVVNDVKVAAYVARYVGGEIFNRVRHFAETHGPTSATVGDIQSYLDSNFPDYRVGEFDVTHEISSETTNRAGSLFPSTPFDQLHVIRYQGVGGPEGVAVVNGRPEKVTANKALDLVRFNSVKNKP